MFDLKIKILIVDDMPKMRKIAIKCLKEIGFSEITEAVDGADAWTKITQEKPGFSLVVTDCEMPNSTGIDLIKRVRTDSRFLSLPIVLLALDSEVAQVDEAMKSGANACILKPFNTQTLKETLDSVHRNHRVVQGR